VHIRFRKRALCISKGALFICKRALCFCRREGQSSGGDTVQAYAYTLQVHTHCICIHMLPAYTIQQRHVHITHLSEMQAYAYTLYLNKDIYTSLNSTKTYSHDSFSQQRRVPIMHSQQRHMHITQLNKHMLTSRIQPYTTRTYPQKKPTYYRYVRLLYGCMSDANMSLLYYICLCCIIFTSRIQPYTTRAYLFCGYTMLFCGYIMLFCGYVYENVSVVSYMSLLCCSHITHSTIHDSRVSLLRIHNALLRIQRALLRIHNTLLQIRTCKSSTSLDFPSLHDSRVSAKEVYVFAKEAYVFAKEAYVLAKERRGVKRR